jgi:hypothetical protein
MKKIVSIGLLWSLAFSTPVLRGAEPLRGYHAKVAVTAPTRMDWTFVLANQSLEKLPADWLPDYDSTRQHYELFVPPDYDPKRTYPVVLFISPGDGPAGWKNWEKVCKERGILFASVHGAGNNCPTPRRIRIVLDVLDEVRRLYRTDPDRTYLSGFSGGGRIACGIAFALPEYFGGVIPVCAGGNLRQESWLRQRVVDRLSVAYLTGETDFNRGEVERYRGPFTQAVGVRTRVWVQPKLGHGIPSEQTLAEAYQWLEEGLAARRDRVQRYPAMRVDGDAAPARAEQAKALLAEGQKRLQARETLYSGLMQMKGCMVRWDGLPAAAEAKKILLEHDARPDRPWEAEDIAEQRLFLIAQARTLDAYVSGPLAQPYVKMRGDMVKQALQLWDQVLKDGQDARAVEEARQRIPALQKLLDAGSEKP